MSASDESLDRLHRERMLAEGMPEVAIRSFLRALRFVREGGGTTLAEGELEPVEALPRADGLSDFEGAGREALARTVVLKLNGGLGTSMGLTGPKSLLPVRGDATFLDLIARQVLHLRDRERVRLPLLLMNSFRTRAPSLARLERHDGLVGPLPLDFLQHRVPRIDPQTFEPIDWPDNPDLAWCPPGHGDLYAAIASSGLLGRLLEEGIRYAFVSNADNLGGAIDLPILGWFASEGLPFAMEVAERTAADRKGGHLARREGRLVLRESAQCAPEDVPSFQDITRHRYFNTNNLWLDLEAVASALESSPDGLPLPVMTNAKTVVSDDPDSPRCLQLETAMGAAIECFEGAQAICVSRERFAPVKTTADLLAVRSDAFELLDDGRLVAVDAEATRRRVIELDDRFYRSVEHLDARFPYGPPSLAKARLLKVEGDHRFGQDVVVLGDVHLVADGDEPVEVTDGRVLEGER